MNTRLNKKVKKDLDAYFKGYKGSDPEVHHALKFILMGALTDANFHSSSKKAANMFPKADKSKFAGKTDFEDSIEQNHGVPIAKAAKWDGHEIIDAISYWASMFIGGPVGAKISSLKEGINENFRTFVNQFIKEVTHSYDYETMSGKRENMSNEDENDKEEFRIGDYHTKYFHVCPGASSLYMDIESKGVDMDMAERSARLHDVLFFVEEHIQRDGYKPERDYIMVAKNLQKNIMKMAEMMGLEKEHNYIQGHVDTIIKTVEGKKLEERVIELTEKNVPTNPSKWSYYKSQAKKKFDVYPSAYANAWAAKQYKAAGGGWRTTKESVNEAKYKVGDTITVIRKDGMKYKGKVEKLNPLKLRTDSTSTVVLPNPMIKKVVKESVNEYFVENFQDVKELVEFLKENKPSISEAEYQGRKVELNKIMQGDVKKFKVYVNNPAGNVVKVNFGAKGMNIKKNNPERRKSFRARHNCDNPGPKHKARYWSCRKW